MLFSNFKRRKRILKFVSPILRIERKQCNFVNLSIFQKDLHNLCKISIYKIAQFDRVVNISSPNKSFSTVLCYKSTKTVAIQRFNRDDTQNQIKIQRTHSHSPPFTLNPVPTLDRCQTEVRGRHLRQSNIGFSQERRRK